MRITGNSLHRAHGGVEPTRVAELHAITNLAKDFVGGLDTSGDGTIDIKEFTTELKESKAMLCMFAELLPFPHDALEAVQGLGLGSEPIVGLQVVAPTPIKIT